MATIGPHFKWSADPAHRQLLTRFFTEVLEAAKSTPAPHVDSFTLNPRSTIGVVYGHAGEALAESEQPKSTWVEFLVRDVDSCTRKLLELGVAPLEYTDQAHVYFRVPGGPVFRLAKETA